MTDQLCIGVVAPFSTEEAIVAGPLLAAVEASSPRPVEPVRVIARDDGRDPERAAEAVAAIIAEPGCIGVVGPKNSGCALAAAPLGRGREECRWSCPALPPTGSPAPTAWSFGCARRTRATAAAAIELAGELGVARLTVVADDTAYGQGLAATIAAAAEGSGDHTDRRVVERRGRLPRHGRGRAGER